MRTFKWFRAGVIDPDTGARWETLDDAGWTPMRPRFGANSHAIAVGGLAYEMDDELWEVELRDVVGHKPFPEQVEHVPVPGMLRDDEQRIEARRGRVLRRVEAWTRELDQTFMRELAARARTRVLQALQDATAVLTAAADPILPDTDEDTTISLGHETAVLLHTERVVRMWREALTASEERGELGTIEAARAAALTRQAAALTYASEIESGDGADPVSAAAIAYLESRRWQSMWLAERLGLSPDDHGADITAPAPSTTSGTRIDGQALPD